MYEVINIKRPHDFSGLYGVEILSKDHAKVERFHDFWMDKVGKEWQIFFQGGSHDYPNTDWVLFEFWVPFDKDRIAELLDYTAEIVDELELETKIV